MKRISQALTALFLMSSLTACSGASQFCKGLSIGSTFAGPAAAPLGLAGFVGELISDSAIKNRAKEEFEKQPKPPSVFIETTTPAQAYDNAVPAEELEPGNITEPNGAKK